MFIELRAAAKNRKTSEIAQDDEFSDAVDLVEDILDKWEREFDDFAERVANRFVRDVEGSAARKIAKAKPDISISATRSQILQAFGEDASSKVTALIKSIPADLKDSLSKDITKATLEGRNAGAIYDAVIHRYNGTRAKARLLARDQTNKIFETATRSYFQSVGLVEAEWIHRGGSKHPRPVHEEFDGQRFNLNEGLFDPTVGRNVLPAELINCNCTFRLIVPEVADNVE